MKKRDRTYELILETSFNLFLEKGYETSITDIENATGLTRGAIFYYVKDKQELFNAVIEKFIFEKQTINNKVKFNGDDSLADFIDKYVDSVKNTQAILTPQGLKNPLGAYLGLSYTGLKHYESYSKKITFVLSMEKSIWKMFTENAISTGEIRSEVDPEIAATTFQSIFYGLTYTSSMNNGLDADQLHNVFIDYYDTLK